jgi:predicted NACHT family NTPase
VVVGDPGSGKSTLLQYLALDWAVGNGEDNRARLPLLIELREYVNDRSQSKTFLEFLETSTKLKEKLKNIDLNDTDGSRVD